jgi:hypothetical protein
MFCERSMFCERFRGDSPALRRHRQRALAPSLLLDLRHSMHLFRVRMITIVRCLEKGVEILQVMLFGA